MNTTELIGVISMAIGIIVWLCKLTWTMAQFSTKIETMWAFQMRRAFSEVVAKGIGTINSPLRFAPDVRDKLSDIKTELIVFWQTKPKGLTDAEILLKLEEKFGQILLEKVCV